jgi:hypothetical protein
MEIAVAPAVVIGDSAVFDTNRSVTGQDGIGFDAPPEGQDTPPAALAVRLFSAVPGLRHVFIGSSQVVLTRNGGWEHTSVDAAASVIGRLFVHYGS